MTETVDDRPFGGEEGMVLKTEPIFVPISPDQKVLLLAQGRMFWSPPRLSVVSVSPAQV